VAASNYSVNITLNTSSARNSLQALEKRINTLRRNLNEPLKIDSRVSKIQEKIAKSKDAQKASMIETRRLGDQVQKLADKGLKVDKARAAIRKAAALDSKNQLKAAASQRKIAQDELKLQTDITEEIAKRTQLISSGRFAGGKNFGQIGGSIGPALPPRAGAGAAGGGRGFDFQSALISGGFPLLFGQGPFVGAAGALGGGIGGMFGQMGGFAGGIAATTAATAIQSFTVETGKLGAALNDATKDVEAVSAALGITGTEFEKQLQTLQKLGGEEAAFEAARQRMINLVGQQGVDALTKFGDEFTELGNNFAKIMTLMKSSFAKFLQESGIGKFISQKVETSALLRQADQSENKDIQKLVELRNRISSPMGSVKEQQEAGKLVGIEVGRFGFRDMSMASQVVSLLNERITKEQKLVNEKNNQLDIEKSLKKIQGTRMDDINEEIALLERSFNMSSEEFEIEKQIMEMNKESKILDEEAIKAGLRRISDLEKQRDLARETAEAFKQMQQTIATDIADGIQGMIRGTSTLNDVLSNVLNKLIDASFNMAFFGNIQGSLGGGGLFGSVLGLFGGGKKGGGVTNSVFTPSVNSVIDNPFVLPKAAGGPVNKGGSFIVGEKGPELFVPSKSGTIVPNHALGGSTNVVVNVDASGSSVQGDDQSATKLGELIGAAVQSEIVKQKMDGGLLS